MYHSAPFATDADPVRSCTQEVIAMSSTTEQPDPRRYEDLSTEELIRRQGIKPIASVDELAQPDPWESDEEYQEFLDDLYASRRASLA